MSLQGSCQAEHGARFAEVARRFELVSAAGYSPAYPNESTFIQTDTRLLLVPIVDAADVRNLGISG